LAQQAIDALGYDFGAVDIIRRRDKLYVLEVNSSPGLEDRKLQLYADYFKQKELEWRQNAI
jgi:glutathione synthase/RimK-type ligase-like ATP-grasp enzyme